MNDTPKIINATSFRDGSIEIYFENGKHGKFIFSHFYDFLGYFEFLKDTEQFLKLKIEESGDYIYWLDSNNEEIEIDPEILYSICTNQKIIIDNKTVFDPSLGKQAWL